ncbi:MAG: Rpn family recombination-promoting nuclease/putative transposase [Atopobiaceae bacterium]|nr:Rpn family recombination-promoting nuclease/putative transposase [Atopobiaceae bacterium]
MASQDFTGIQLRNMRDLERSWNDLTFENDFVFGAVLRSDLDLCRRLLEAVLDMPIERVTLVQPQRTGDISYEAKAVRLDVYAADGTGVVYDIEMQRLNATNLPRRARYYQSLLDSEQLDKGADYNDLPDTFVIFFCTFDPFRKGFRRYTFRQTCQEDPSIKAEDGALRIFLNSSGRKGEVSKDLEELLLYLNGGYHSDNSLVGDIDAGVKRVLASDELRRQFVVLELKLMDERRAAIQEGRAEGLAEGRAEGRADAISSLSALRDALVSVGRENELLDALDNQERLERLYEEFGIDVKADG